VIGEGGLEAVLDEAALRDWGSAVGRAVEVPGAFALSGDLGAGKSVLARAIARGRGVTGMLPSPTFNLVLHHQAHGAEVVHIDLYRVHDPGELWELGWADLGGATQLLLIEWAERAGTLLPEPRWDVHLEHVPGRAELRRVRARTVGGAPPLPSFPDAPTPTMP